MQNQGNYVITFDTQLKTALLYLGYQVGNLNTVGVFAAARKHPATS